MYLQSLEQTNGAPSSGVSIRLAHVCMTTQFSLRNYVDHCRAQETRWLRWFRQLAQPSAPQVGQERIPVHLYGCGYVFRGEIFLLGRGSIHLIYMF